MPGHVTCDDWSFQLLQLVIRYRIPPHPSLMDPSRDRGCLQGESTIALPTSSRQGTSELFCPDEPVNITSQEANAARHGDNAEAFFGPFGFRKARGLGSESEPATSLGRESSADTLRSPNRTHGSVQEIPGSWECSRNRCAMLADIQESATIPSVWNG